MASINDVCARVVKDVDGALACGVVDLNTGLMLGVAHSIPYFTQTYLDAVAAGAVDMFRGRGISAVEELLSSVRGTKLEKSVQEMQMTTTGTYHFMSVCPDKQNALVVLITNKKVNIGMGWASLRRELPELSKMCP